MSWLEKLGMRTPAPNQQSGAPAPSNAGGNNPTGEPSTPPSNNGTPGTNGQNADPSSNAKDPLAVFNKMYDNPSNTEAAPTFNLDSKQLAEVASSQDFTQGINAELFQKATTGDLEAMKQLLNTVGRNAYSASLSHGSRLTDTFVSAREQHSSKGFGSKVKGELISQGLSSIPNYNNPVVRQQLKDTAERLQRQFPEASSDEIKQKAIEYFTELSEAINPQRNKKAAENARNEPTNYDEWLDN